MRATSELPLTPSLPSSVACVRQVVAERRQLRIRDEAPLYELPDDRAHAPVHDQFRDDEQRQCQQKAHVQLDVVEERQRDAPAPRVPLRDRQHQ